MSYHKIYVALSVLNYDDILGVIVWKAKTRPACGIGPKQ